MSLEYPPRRFRRGTVRLVGALVIAVLLGVLWWAVGDGFRRYDAEVVGQVLVSADGRTVTTTARWTGCEHRPRLVARESAGGVRLALHREDRSQPGQICDGGDERQLSTRLAAPLGSRPLVDAVSGRPIGWVRWAATGQPGLPACWLRADRLSRLLQCRRSRLDAGVPLRVRLPLLSIKQVTGVLPEVQGDVVTVHGHPARYREGSGTDRSVTWFDGSFTLTVLSVEPVVGLPQAELLRIAENVNPPASHGQAG